MFSSVVKNARRLAVTVAASGMVLPGPYFTAAAYACTTDGQQQTCETDQGTCPTNAAPAPVVEVPRNPRPVAEIPRNSLPVSTTVPKNPAPVANNELPKNTTPAPTPGPQPAPQGISVPPLRGDFPAMVFQVRSHLDWLTTAHKDHLTPEALSQLAEGRKLLDTSCAVCDSDRNLFDPGADSSSGEVRDVAKQLDTFSSTMSELLTKQPYVGYQEGIAKNGLEPFLGTLNADEKASVFAMLSLKALDQYGKELKTHAHEIEQGTFHPVSDEKLAGQVKVGEKAPDFTAVTLDGKQFRLSEHANENVVLVFEKGAWCFYCLNQVDQLIGNADRFNKEGVKIVFVFRELKPGTQPADGIKGLQEFAKTHNSPFTYVVDWGSSATGSYNPEGSYGTYIIGKGGMVENILYGSTFLRPNPDAMLNALQLAQK